MKIKCVPVKVAASILGVNQATIRQLVNIIKHADKLGCGLKLEEV